MKQYKNIKTEAIATWSETFSKYHVVYKGTTQSLQAIEVEGSSDWDAAVSETGTEKPHSLKLADLIGTKTAIHCPTQGEWDKCLKIIRKSDYKCTITHNGFYNGNMYLYLLYDKLTYYSSTPSKSYVDTIIPAADFIAANTPEPLFVTKDGVPIYDGNAEMWFCYKTGYRGSGFKDSPSPISCYKMTNFEPFYVFSTKAACQAYLDSIHKPKEPAYKIESFVASNNPNEIWRRTNGGNYSPFPSDSSALVTLDDMLHGEDSVEDGTFKIHSIRKGNEVFSLDDKFVTDKNIPITIKSFTFNSENKLWINGCWEVDYLIGNILRHYKHKSKPEPAPEKTWTLAELKKLAVYSPVLNDVEYITLKLPDLQNQYGTN